MITRQEYLTSKDPDIHQKYYAQFVTEELKQLVLSTFGIDKLRSAYEESETLDAIPVHHWDCLLEVGDRHILPGYINLDLLKQAGQPATLSTMTCISKNAARQLIKEYKSK